MHAEITVSHTATPGNELYQQLIRAFGPDNRDAVLDESPVCRSRRDAWRRLVLYASERPPYRIICLPVRDEELQVIVESVEDAEIRDACQSAWNGLRNALKGKGATLQKLEVYELGYGRSVLTARTGWSAELQSQEIRQLIVIGAISLAIILVGRFTFARNEFVSLVSGAAPGLGSIATAIGLGATNLMRGRLRWFG